MNDDYKELVENEPALFGDIMAEMLGVELEQYITTPVTTVEEINPNNNFPGIATEVVANAILEDNKAMSWQKMREDKEYDKQNNDESIIEEEEMSGIENL